MSFTREINRLLYGFLITSFVIFGAAFYWSVVGSDTILQRNDNPRLFEAESTIQRGAITDRNGHILAQTQLDEDGNIQRRYSQPAAYSPLGYYSLRYGSAGAEAAYDAILRGDDLPDTLSHYFERDILHRPQVGSDVALTLDLEVQRALADALAGQRGAGVVISVPDGAILALVSQPTIDPNTLDASWDQLIAREDQPFYNRALQGRYQPGGMLQTPLMTAAILTQQPFDVVTADANQPIQVNDVWLGCAQEPPEADLTYAQAYAYACPRPFALLASRITDQTLQNILDAFRLGSPPGLDGFVAQPLSEQTPEPDATRTIDPVQEALGQGVLTINPLGMATVAAAVINEGNAPSVTILQSMTGTDGVTVPAQANGETIAMMTTSAARRMRELMVHNAVEGAAQAAARESLVIGGHTALAASGDGKQVWFIGFVTLENTRGAAIALVLEASEQTDRAADIGGSVLAIAAERLHTDD